jgi:hypothetical protein
VPGLSDSKTVDVVAEDAAGEVAVVMIEDRPWTGGRPQELELREKINTYTDFISGGELVRRFPNAAGRSVRIHLDCVEEPSGTIATVIEYAKEQLGKLGIGFTVNVRD